MAQERYDKLQCVQNVEARVVSHTQKRDHITPIRYDLHWLPVREQVEFKVLSLTYNTFHGTAPQYFQE